MGEVLGRVAMAIFGCVMLFIMPIMLIAQKQDSVAQNYIDNAVVEFVDNARAAGKITPKAYEELCYKVDMAHMICEISMTHSASYTTPKSTTPNPDGSFETITYRYDTTKDEIVDKMFPDAGENKDYIMKNGDYLKVEVRNISPTLGVRMTKFFMGRKNNVALYSSYGGYVGNNKQ